MVGNVARVPTHQRQLWAVVEVFGGKMQVAVLVEAAGGDDHAREGGSEKKKSGGVRPDKSGPVNWEDCREKKSDEMKDVN